MVFFVLGIGPVMLVTKIADLYIPQESTKRAWFQPIFNAVFFRVTLRTVLEGFVELLITGLVNLQDVSLSL